MARLFSFLKWFTEKNLFHPHFLDQMHAQVIADAPMKKLRGHVKKLKIFT